MATNTVRILHISDIHRGKNAPTSNGVLWGKLKDDIQRTYAEDNDKLSKDEPQLGPPDIIVVSGDITQHAEPSEFIVAQEFLENLSHLVNGDRSRIVFVPGNHDVSWNLSRETYVPATEQEYRDQPIYDEPYRQVVKKERDAPIYWRKTEDNYTNRFLPFKTFFDDFYRGSSPSYTFSLERQKMYTVYDYSERFGIIMAGFNTCDEIDHLDRRASINSDAIFNAESDPAFDSHNNNLVRIAVFHHNIRSVNYGEDFLDPKYLQLLKRHGFDFCLHGHVHSSGIDIFDPARAKTLSVLGSGSLAAPYQDRPPAVPKGYNLLVVNREDNSVYAHTRRHDENDLVWAADYRWDGKPYVLVRPPGPKKPESLDIKGLVILAPDGIRFEADVPADLTIELLLQAFLKEWRVHGSTRPQHYYLYKRDNPTLRLSPSDTLHGSEIANNSTLVLGMEPLEPDSAIALFVEDKQGAVYSTAVLLNTPIAKLAEAFLGQSATRPVVEAIADSLAAPRTLRSGVSLFDEGIGENMRLRIYNAAHENAR